MNIEAWHEVNGLIQKPDEACLYIGELMKGCKDKMFNELIAADFTNHPTQIHDSIVTFCYECNKAFELRAIYLEMNGFDINPKRWFFNFFGYNTIHQNDDTLDWLAYWQSPDYPSITLTGLEAIQNIYSEYQSKKLYKDKDKQLNEELATLLVMAKFCKLIAKSVDDIKLGIHIYATAHDFDIIYQKRP